MSEAAKKRYRKKARESWGKQEDIEVDNDAQVSLADGGAYVQAWVWVEEDRLHAN